jgi:hypothetical protein
MPPAPRADFRQQKPLYLQGPVNHPSENNFTFKKLKPSPPHYALRTSAWGIVVVIYVEMLKYE